MWSPRDDLVFGAVVREGAGGYIPTTQGVVTNFGGTLGGQNPTIVGGMTGGNSFNATTAAGVAARKTYDSLVTGRTITAFGAKIGYQHWWTAELRSNIDFGVWHQDISFLPSLTATNRASLNKELTMSHVNLMWRPVAFVSTGVEYTWGHRVTASSAKGDSHVIQGLLRVSF